METHIRTLAKTLSYRTAVALSILLASIIMNYGAGFGLIFVVLSYTVGFASFWVQERLWNLVKWGMKETYETHKRTIVKTITWRLWSLFVLFVFGLLLGLSTEHAVEWTIVTNILFIVVHYLHERLWNLISWGKNNLELSHESTN